MRRTIIVLCLCFLGQTPVAFSAQAQAPRPILPAWERIRDQALQKVNWDWKPVFPDWKMEFGPGLQGLLGVTDTNTHEIALFVRPAASPESVAGTIVHELAHAFDAKYLTTALRVEWLAARNFPPDTPWYPPNFRSDYIYGAGDFAESVKWTLQGSATSFWSCLGLPHVTETDKRWIALGMPCSGVPPNEKQQALIRKWLAELPRAGRK